MDELTSTQFRSTFHKLTEKTTVTVNGHSIGVWYPAGSEPTAKTKEASPGVLAPAESWHGDRQGVGLSKHDQSSGQSRKK